MQKSDKSLAALDRVVSAVENVGAGIGAWVIFGLLWLSVAEILSRNFLGMPLRGQFDILVLVGPMYGLLGLSYCYRKAGHVCMDLVSRKLTGRSAQAAEILIAVCALLITVQLIQGSFSHFSRSCVVGYDDIPSAALGAYRISTIRQPVRKLAAKAVSTILDFDSGTPPDLTTSLIAPVFIPRDTI